MLGGTSVRLSPAGVTALRTVTLTEHQMGLGEASRSGFLSLPSASILGLRPAHPCPISLQCGKPCTDPDGAAGVPGSFSPSALRFSAASSALSWSEASSSSTAEGPWSSFSSSPAGRGRCWHRLLSTCPYLKGHACLTCSPRGQETPAVLRVPLKLVSSGALSALRGNPLSAHTGMGVQTHPPSTCHGSGSAVSQGPSIPVWVHTVTKCSSAWGLLSAGLGDGSCSHNNVTTYLFLNVTA